MTQEELNLHIAEASATLSSLLSSLAASEDSRNRKKSMLLGYWIKKYVSLIKKESHFSPRSIPRYKRGQVLNVDFGFRVGHELGGLHYAVVLDVNNNQSSSVITVVPLMSFKAESFKENNFTTLLSDGVYIALDNKLSGLMKQAQKLIDESSCEGISEFEAKAKREVARNTLVSAENALSELKHLKSGTVANTCQITTISKMRIAQPLNTSDALYGVRLSNDDMDCIYEQLRRLYLIKHAKRMNSKNYQRIKM